ncbi:MAG: putative anti-sigma regulatory factor, serine/threonine protein kinase [Actinomycetia bacterium]|nr:putative anti-sigma regulatory factor, serine/threonine protein kinase [Actinomycetes bacterium]
MATVELSFSALPVHVRTARLIVTAVARRSGVPETLLDEVRLAVGEACSRAVEAHLQHCPDEPVRLELIDDKDRFEVIVSDSVPGDDAAGTLPAAPSPDQDEWHELSLAALGDGVGDLGLAVIAGLADDVVVSSTPKGVQIRMSWPK